MAGTGSERGDEHGALLEGVLATVSTAVAVLRAPGFTFELANRACREMAAGRVLVGRALGEENPEAAARLLPLLQRVAATGEPVRLQDVALPVPGQLSPDPMRTFTLVLQRLPLEPGGAPAVLVTADETTEQVRARREVERALETERLARARLAQGQQLTGALASARTVQEVADAVFQAGLAAFGAVAGWIALPDGPDHLAMRAAVGYPEARLAAWRRVPLSTQAPVTEAYRDGRAVFVERRADLERRYPALAAASPGSRHGVAALPLLVDGATTGVLALTFPDERHLDDDDRRHVAWLAQKCAQALERARRHEAERSAREQAVETGRLQERLLAVVGHDLRSPLTAISATAALLARRGGLDEWQDTALHRVSACAARMSAIIHDLLDLSAARQGLGIPVQRAPIDLAEVVRQAVQALEAGGAAGRLGLRLEGDTRLEADPARLAQVVINLVSNALQHGQGSPVEIALEGRRDEVVLRVHNGGEPIAPELLPHLFEPFRRGEHAPAASAGHASIGLGLFIVREIVRAHGGEVEARSGPGAGTTLEARLPRLAPQADQGAPRVAFSEAVEP